MRRNAQSLSRWISCRAMPLSFNPSRLCICVMPAKPPVYLQSRAISLFRYTFLYATAHVEGVASVLLCSCLFTVPRYSSSNSVATSTTCSVVVVSFCLAERARVAQTWWLRRASREIEGAGDRQHKAGVWRFFESNRGIATGRVAAVWVRPGSHAASSQREE